MISPRLACPGSPAWCAICTGTALTHPCWEARREVSRPRIWNWDYVIQSGALKGLGLRLREAFYRNNLTSAATFYSDNETRINIDYTYKFRWVSRKPTWLRMIYS